MERQRGNFLNGNSSGVIYSQYDSCNTAITAVQTHERKRGELKGHIGCVVTEGVEVVQRAGIIREISILIHIFFNRSHCFHTTVFSSINGGEKIYTCIFKNGFFFTLWTKQK